MLGRFSEPADEVSDLIADAAVETERLVDQIATAVREVIE